MSVDGAPSRSTVAFVCVVGVVFTLPAAASANTYCVADAACVSGGGTSEPDVQSGLSAAQSNAGHDRVQIGAGTFMAATTSGFTYLTADAANSVDVVGAGSSQTTLQAPTPAGNGGATTLTVSGPAPYS